MGVATPACSAPLAAVKQWTEHGGPNQLVAFEGRPDGWAVLKFKVRS